MTDQMQQSRRAPGGQRRGSERQTHWHLCTAGGTASRWVVHSDRWLQATAAGKDVAAYFRGNQDKRNVFVDWRSGPDRVRGNLFPAQEIYFPGINIPSHFQDGGLGGHVIIYRKVLPSGECTDSICLACMQQHPLVPELLQVRPVTKS